MARRTQITPRAAAYILVIGERNALAWVLAERRMVFPARTRGQAMLLVPGDSLFLYATRGCFRNPTRDRGRIIGEARVATPVTQLSKAIRFGDRVYPLGCEIDVASLLPRGLGVELASLVDVLRVFPEKSSWSAWMRRTLLPLGDADAGVIRRGLRGVMAPTPETVATYLRFVDPG
jgi:hypothetical protein